PALAPIVTLPVAAEPRPDWNICPARSAPPFSAREPSTETAPLADVIAGAFRTVPTETEAASAFAPVTVRTPLAVVPVVTTTPTLSPPELRTSTDLLHTLPVPVPDEPMPMIRLPSTGVAPPAVNCAVPPLLTMTGSPET